jgi:hypothetical protein
MRSSPHLRSVPFAIFVLLFLPCVILAQPAPCRDHSSLASHKSSEIKINVVDVEFTPQSSLPDELRADIVERIRSLKINASPRDPDADWPNTLGARAISSAIRAHGYFQASWKLTPYLVKANGALRLTWKLRKVSSIAWEPSRSLDLIRTPRTF